MTGFALSIMQPWCGLIAMGLKDVENRDWPTRHRGRVLLHAGRTRDADAWDDVDEGYHPVTDDPLDRETIKAAVQAGAFFTGGIVGEARIVDCVERSDNPWFVGPYGFVMADARVTPFRPCKGALGFFTPDFESRYVARRGKKGGTP